MPIQKNLNIKQYPSLARLPTSGKTAVLDGGLHKLEEGSVGPGVCGEAQVQGKNGKVSRDDCRLHSWAQGGGSGRWEG